MYQVTPRVIALCKDYYADIVPLCSHSTNIRTHLGSNPINQLLYTCVRQSAAGFGTLRHLIEEFLLPSEQFAVGRLCRLSQGSLRRSNNLCLFFRGKLLFVQKFSIIVRTNAA